MQNNDELIESFVTYLEERGKGGGIAAGFKMEVKAFAKFLESRGESLLTWKQEDIDAYGKQLADNGKSGLTIHRRLQNLLVFTKYLIAEGKLVRQAESQINESTAFHRSFPRPLSTDEVKKLILACPEIKSRTLFTFLYETGIRPEATAKLKQDDVNWDDLYILVKGREDEKGRPVFFNRKLKELLRKYIRTRKDSLPYLFAEGRAPMTKTRMQVLFREYADKIGLEGYVGADSLWRSRAAHMLEQGFDAGTVGQLLGAGNLQALEELVPVVVSARPKGGQFISALDM